MFSAIGRSPVSPAAFFAGLPKVQTEGVMTVENGEVS